MFPGPGIYAGPSSFSLLSGSLGTRMLVLVSRQKDWPMTLRIQPGYDHSYYFIASFIEDHLRFHAQHLLS